MIGGRYAPRVFTTPPSCLGNLPHLARSIAVGVEWTRWKSDRPKIRERPSHSPIHRRRHIIILIRRCDGDDKEREEKERWTLGGGHTRLDKVPSNTCTTSYKYKLRETNAHVSFSLSILFGSNLSSISFLRHQELSSAQVVGPLGK